jgi:DNA-binding IclR family transcriptional regulator
MIKPEDLITGDASAEAKAGSGTQLLDKALDLINLIERTGLRLNANAIAELSGYPKPTVYRILSALVRRGYIQLDRRDQAYELGLRFTELAAAFGKSHRLVMLIEKELIQLSERTGETVSVGIPELDGVRLVGRYNLGLESLTGGGTGTKRPYHASAIGKAIISWADDQSIRRYLSRTNFQQFTPRTIGSTEKLLADMQMVRARGYAFDDEEILAGIRCVAVPLFTAKKDLIGAASLSAPAYRLPTQRVNEIVAALNVLAANVTQRLSDSALVSSLSREGLKCLRIGGLFKPSAVAAFADRVVVVDGAAPAIYNFYNSGKHHAGERLPFLPHAAAIASDGSILLSRDEKTYSWIDGKLQELRQFDGNVTGLSFSPNGRAYASVSTKAALYDAISGKFLFRTKAHTDAITATEDEIFILDAENAQVEVRKRTSTEIVGRYQCGSGLGKLEAITTDGRHIWITGLDTWRVEEIDRRTTSVRRVILPERSVTAIAFSNGSLALAGSNLHASLSDRLEHSSGSLYLLETSSIT